MLRLEAFEALGPALAVMSDLGDGDCAKPAGRERFLRGIGLASRDLYRLRQVHGDTIVEAAGSGHANDWDRQGDALVARAPGIPLGVTVADCVPVFLFSTEPAAVALVHAGREGTRRGIVAAAVGRMTGDAPNRVHALIGPSAGPCCYEVSGQMAAEWTAAGLPAAGRRLDLWEANRRQLTNCGVPAAQVVVHGHCTICGGRFHSYRAGGTAARNLAVLML